MLSENKVVPDLEVLLEAEELRARGANWDPMVNQGLKDPLDFLDREGQLARTAGGVVLVKLDSLDLLAPPARTSTPVR